MEREIDSDWREREDLSDRAILEIHIQDDLGAGRPNWFAWLA
jgi:hypothetical protein